MATTTSDAGIRLVLGVARLGEADLAAWCNVHGLDPVGRYVLRRSFHRTWQSAALELDVLCAARRHNDVLGGRRSAFHLFSDELPFRRWATSWLGEQKTSTQPDPLFDELESWKLDDAHAALQHPAGRQPAAEVVGDGLRLGEVSTADMSDENGLISIARDLAACYLRIGEPFRAPYFDFRG
jgi:hypothetical protein